jgi:hypothetical protein
MPDKLPASIENKLPTPTKYAGEIAKLVTGVASAFAGIWFPAAAIAGAVFPIVIDRYIDRPKDLLLKELQKGNISDLSAEQLAPFVPMAYKFLEAAKEGEYEHNLEILAAYLAGEMKQEIPDAASFSRMVRRVEGLSNVDLQVMALIDASPSSSSIIRISMDEPAQGERPFASASFLASLPQNIYGLTRSPIAESLADLTARGFLIADGATRTDKFEEYYRASDSLIRLMERARSRIKERSGPDNRPS